MKIKFITLILSILLTPFLVMGQVQLGYVKTKGRLVANGSVVPGVRVSGASVIIKGGNAVVSNAKGNFQLSVPNKKFHLVNVKKSGYILTDPDILSKQYTSSSNPLVIALEKPEEQSEEKMAAMKKIRRTLERQLQEKEDEIDALKAQNKLSAEAYSKALQELYAEREKNGTLIEEMAERYSRIDYDQLDEFNRRVSELILNGELLRADSLLNTKGDIRTGIADYQRLQQANANEETALAQRQTSLEKSKALEQQQRDDLARRCYSKYEIFKLQHQNDSAAYYIELRASLDTMNVEWLLNAGVFIFEYLADYDKAMTNYQRALNNALQQYGEWSEAVAMCYNNIGLGYESLGNYPKALGNLQRALDIRLSLLDENHPDLALSYNNIGAIYSSLGDYAKAVVYHQKALTIRLSVFGENHPDVANSYNSLGFGYTYLGDYVKALGYHQKALQINLSVFGENHLDIALSYNNIGGVYTSQGDYVKALEYYQKALKIDLLVLGANHPSVATIYNNIGSAYDSLGDYVKALEYYQKSLEILLSVFGEIHPYVATNYNNIGSAYGNQGDYTEALDYYQKALDISLKLYGEDHAKVIQLYTNMYICLTSAARANQSSGKYNLVDFMSDKAFVAMVVSTESPAGKQGMLGEYYVLELEDWYLDKGASLIETNMALRGKSKTILVMKDGEISQHYFENAIGAGLVMKYIGKEEKERINKAYHTWKTKNR